ncbi:MAG: deoxyribonuclease V [Planctomycetota bacterium]
MPANELFHPWDVTTAEAREIQNRLRSKVVQRGRPRVKHVAGVDISIRGDWAIAAVPVLRFEDLQIVDLAIVEQKVPFPYVPGYLSFRECPSILAAIEKLDAKADLILVDGQGIAHPRRFGLASHLGVLLDTPSIGCAKTRFIGVHDKPAEEAGCYTDLWDVDLDGNDELIGAVLRTRDNVKPMYISVGHKLDLPTALDLVLACGNGYRLPEPTRLAHQAAGGSLKWP